MGIKEKIFSCFLGMLFFSYSLFSCEVPVFRYAMEFWSADRYDVYIFNNGELKKEKDKTTFNLLKEFSIADYKSAQANIEVHFVDISSKDTTSQEIRLWEEQKTNKLPWVSVYYPFVHGKERKVWAGELKSISPNFLLTSPKRRDIVKRLLEGESAVWIFLESGNSSVDSKTLRLLNRELMRLERTLKLPIPETWGWAGSADSIDLNRGNEGAADTAIKFSILSISPNDPAEEMLLNILLKSEKDLNKYKGQPIVFPIYGRGLILYALVGAGINEWTLNKAGEFVTGPCSCEVKAGNPGTDILLQANWENRQYVTLPEETPPLTGVSEFFSRVEKEKELAVTLSSSDISEITQLEQVETNLLIEDEEVVVPLTKEGFSDKTPPYKKLLIILISGVVVILFGLTFILSKRQIKGRKS